MEGRKELVRELSYIVENRGDNACSAEEKLRQVAAVLKEYISPSRGVTLTNKQQEVAILKLEQDRLLEESKEDRRKIADLTERLTATEKQLEGKKIVESHLNRNIREATEKIQRIESTLVEKEEDIANKDEYINILEKRTERYKANSENAIQELKESIEEQNRVILALEEKALFDSNEKSKEAERFRGEILEISLRLQESKEDVLKLQDKLKYSEEATVNYAAMEKKLQEAENFAEEKSNEVAEAIDQIAKLNKNIQALRNENAELVRRVNKTKSELKINQIRYEKLEKAFAESIEKMMSNGEENGAI